MPSMSWEEWIREVAEILDMTPQEVLYECAHCKPKEHLYEGGASPREAADWLRWNA